MIEPVRLVKEETVSNAIAAIKEKLGITEPLSLKEIPSAIESASSSSGSSVPGLRILNPFAELPYEVVEGYFISSSGYITENTDGQPCAYFFFDASSLNGKKITLASWKYTNRIGSKLRMYATPLTGFNPTRAGAIFSTAMSSDAMAESYPYARSHKSINTTLYANCGIGVYFGTGSYTQADLDKLGFFLTIED